MSTLVPALRICAAFAIASFASACATTAGSGSVATSAQPKAQALKITTRIWAPGGSLLEPRSLGFGRLEFASPQPLAGATCVARNNIGTWQVVTPGTVEVAPGGGPLSVECSMPGYEAAKAEISCVTPRSRNTTQGALAGLQLAAALGPAAVYAAPVVVLGAMAGSTAFGAAVGNATAGPDADVCRYFPGAGALDLWMRKK